MEPNSNPIDPFPRMEPEELRERRNAIKLEDEYNACIAALKTWNTRYIDRREI